MNYTHQDWTPVILRNTVRNTAPTVIHSTPVSHTRHIEIADAVKKYVAPESLRDLIQKRVEMKLSQEAADQLCNFSKYTFKYIECNQRIPSMIQQQVIQKKLGVQLKYCKRE